MDNKLADMLGSLTGGLLGTTTPNPQQTAEWWTGPGAVGFATPQASSQQEVHDYFNKLVGIPNPLNPKSHIMGTQAQFDSIIGKPLKFQPPNQGWRG